MIQLSVKECIIPDDTRSYELKKIKALLERCEVVYTETKKADFLTQSFEQDMKRLLDTEQVIKSALSDLKWAMSCATCLIKYLALLSDSSNIGKYTLEVHDLAQYMRLDASAVKALNIMPSAQDGSYSGILPTTFELTQ
jgi:DNA mismatch repair protein MSH2